LIVQVEFKLDFTKRPNLNTFTELSRP